jgi:hypothetical protein
MTILGMERVFAEPGSRVRRAGPSADAINLRRRRLSLRDGSFTP